MQKNTSNVTKNNNDETIPSEILNNLLIENNGNWKSAEESFTLFQNSFSYNNLRK